MLISTLWHQTKDEFAGLSRKSRNVVNFGTRTTMSTGTLAILAAERGNYRPAALLGAAALWIGIETYNMFLRGVEHSRRARIHTPAPR
jgi:hypothetical protein